MEMSDSWRHQESGPSPESARFPGILLGPVGRIQIRQILRSLFSVQGFEGVSDNVL